MPAKKQYRVKATMIVAKVPGAQGGETYLRKSRLLPESVEPTEVKRLLGLGLIEEAKDVPAETAQDDGSQQSDASSQTGAAGAAK